MVDVYSPMDALALARKNPGKEVVFLGVGFETTAPGTASCLLEAVRQGVENFSILCLLKPTEPALRTLVESPDLMSAVFCVPDMWRQSQGATPLPFFRKIMVFPPLSPD